MDDNHRLRFELNDNPEMKTTLANSEEFMAPSNSTALENAFPKEIHRASDLLMSVSVHADTYKTKIINLSVAAMEELEQMALEQEPLWLFNVDRRAEVLNAVEYKNRFEPLDAALEEIIGMIKMGRPIELASFNYTNAEVPNDNGSESSLPMENGPTPPLETEASRASGVVFMNPIDLVNMFMDVDQWSIVFTNIVSKATVLGVVTKGELGNPNGAVQVMKAEFHVPSPLVQTREIYFARYSRRLSLNSWIVVDVSLESIFPNPMIKCRRRPSGCLIRGTPDGFSKVTWVENNEVDNRSVQTMFSRLISSGSAFGANRWLTTLERQCDRLAIHLDDRVTRGGATSLLKLAERMVRCFNWNVSASTENPWRPLTVPGAEDILVRTSCNLDDPGTPRGVAITFATSVWLPVPPENVFDFLCCGKCRSQWDILTSGRVTREILSIPTGRDPANTISLVMVEPVPSKMTMLYVQESFSDSTGYYIAYAPVDILATNSILDSGDPDRVELLASGFSVLPDGRSIVGENGTSGSLLTLLFQTLDEHISTPEYLPSVSVVTIYRVITETVSRIKGCVGIQA
ncbi:unnamed protein product [Ilex paraguariensis]|uniref:START domain-containing protein n=1 Tax=Ilex paraguariensis TaxID=185542 RepID=A0ABC8TGQ7_9AQUA